MQFQDTVIVMSVLVTVEMYDIPFNVARLPKWLIVPAFGQQ
jgi:hypothetical protein